MALKRANWHDPESLSALEDHDSQQRRKKFYVYVLDTDFGHYVGHSGNLGARLNAHMRGRVVSTANGNPKKIWQSAPLPTRADAARFEAALKSWRDNSREEFQQCTGYSPIPFRNPSVLLARPTSETGGFFGASPFCVAVDILIRFVFRARVVCFRAFCSMNLRRVLR